MAAWVRQVLLITLVLTGTLSAAEKEGASMDAPAVAESQPGEMERAVNDRTRHNDFLIVQIRAEAGDLDAMYELARRYVTADGVEKNLRKTLFWYNKAARLGHAPSQLALADMYYTGTAVPQPYYAHALKWYLRAAEQGVVRAEAMSGKMLYKGIGTRRDYKRAFKWMLQAAEDGDPESQHLTGVMFRFGHGIEKNYLRAYIWLHVAAENTENPDEKARIRHQRDRVEQLMPEGEQLGAKLLAPEFLEMHRAKNIETDPKAAGPKSFDLPEAISKPKAMQ